MKSYLSLVPISAKVRRRRSRMTILCIVFAVFLVTAIFSMADMMIRMETMHTKDVHGNWHIRMENITEKEAEEISARPDVAAASWYDAVNLDMDRDYLIGGRQTVLCGIEEAFRTDIMNYFDENSSIQKDDEVILTPNAKKLLGVHIGDSMELNTPSGNYELRVTGFRSDDSRYANNNGGGETTALLVKEEQIGVFLNIASFRRIISENQDEGSPSYYVQFKAHANMKKAIREIRQQFGLTDGEIEQNSMLMGFQGAADNSLLKNLYPPAFLLFLLILLAGVLMISGSLNSNIAERSRFFGMLRCIGADKKQIIRIVRLEALNWCRTAVPTGIIAGTVITWGLCAVLKYIVRGEFTDAPVFGVSAAGVLCGAMVGVLTVLIAAQAPAKRASRVSPVAAVSGSIDDAKTLRRGVRTRFLKIETTLGVSHAAAAKKNLCLMAGSFALSIILFLSFSILVELLGYLLPTKLYAPDISISSSGLSNSVDHELIDKISKMKGVKHVFGRMYEEDIPAEFSVETGQNTVDLISYDELQLQWLPKDHDLRKGSSLSNVYGDNGHVLAIWDEKIPVGIGDKIRLCGSEVEIDGMLKFSPFSNSGGTNGEIILICSKETFTRLTGEQDYSIIDVQVTKDFTDEDADAIRRLVNDRFVFTDRRDEGDRSTFWAFSLFIYGFLAVIALITVLNIVNSISMSVSARIRQYGAMRAVGMDVRQLTRMIAAEAASYALTGCFAGCAVGLPFNRLLYDKLITTHFPYYTWSIPVKSLLIILLFVCMATVVSVHAPAKRIRDMAVTDTINEL